MSNKTNIVVDVTYDQLYYMYDTSGLVPGQKYRITDFRTRHLIPNTTVYNGENSTYSIDVEGMHDYDNWDTLIISPQNPSTGFMLKVGDQFNLIDGQNDGTYNVGSIRWVDPYGFTGKWAITVTGANWTPGSPYGTIEFTPRSTAPETLIVTASSRFAISPIVLSENYPQDIIYYQLDDSSAQGGLLGRITFRKDPLKNIHAYEDWRNVKVRRWNTEADGSGDYTVITDNGNPFQDNIMLQPTVYNVHIGRSDGVSNVLVYGTDSHDIYVGGE